MSKLTLDEAIEHCLEVAEQNEEKAEYRPRMDYYDEMESRADCLECAADHRQLAEWLTKLKEAEDIIRTCKRWFEFLLECQIENTSTAHNVETLLKNITEYLSGGSENG